MPRGVSFSSRHYDSDRFLHQLWAVFDFVRSLWYYHELERQLTEAHRELVFFPYSSQAHRHQAAIAWCKVFGARGSNWTHLHHFQPGAAESFRSGFELAVGRSLADYEIYHEEMTTYRDTYVAHTEPHFGREIIPHFDFALDVAFYWDDWTRHLIVPDTVAAPTLRIQSDIIQRQSSMEIAEILRRLP